MGPTTYLQTLGNSFQVQGGLLPKPPRHHHFPPLLHQKRKRFAARLPVVGNSRFAPEPIHLQPGATLAVTDSPGQTRRKGLIPASRPRQAPDTPKPVPGLIENVLSQVLSWRCLGRASRRWLRHGLSTQPAPRKGSQARRNQRMPSTRWARRRPKRGLGCPGRVACDKPAISRTAPAADAVRATEEDSKPKRVSWNRAIWTPACRGTRGLARPCATTTN